METAIVQDSPRSLPPSRQHVKVKKTVHFEFTQDLVKEPLLYQLTRQFDVVTNIRAASVTEEGGFVVLEMEGEEQVIDRALEYLNGMGIEATERSE